MYKTLNVASGDDIKDDWDKHCLILWEEDDVPVPDKEKVAQAFTRIAGKPSICVEIDHGDSWTQFFRGGWVKHVSFDGGWVGVMVKHEPA